MGDVRDPARLPTVVVPAGRVWTCTAGGCREWGSPGYTESGLRKHQRDEHGILHPSKRSMAEARRLPEVAAAFAHAERLQRQVAEAIERARAGYKHAGMVGCGDVE